MNAQTVGTIYWKELRDALRDRRALLSMIVIPTVLMPALIFMTGKAVSAIISRAKAEVPRIMVVHGDDSPGILDELRKSGRFHVEAASPDWKAQVSDKRVRAAVDIPEGFERALASGSAPAVTLYDYEGELKSGIAANGLRDFFTGLRDRATARILAQRGLPATVARPFEVNEKNVAPPERVGGNLIGGIIPYFIIFLCFTGAMYPAMDITAGEKERGTMELLLASPAARGDIVLGKFLMVLTGSLSSVLFSLVSLLATLSLVGSVSGAAAAKAASAPSVDPLGILGVLAMVLPVAVLFSAALFTLSLFAKSFKEAQSYVGPIAILIALPCVIGMLPGIELNLRLSFVPILNLSLVSKEMLSGVWHWGYIALIFGSSALYAGIALFAADRMFRREAVLFRS